MAALLADGVEAYIGRSLSQRLGEGKHNPPPIYRTVSLE